MNVREMIAAALLTPSVPDIFLESRARNVDHYAKHKAQQKRERKRARNLKRRA